MKKFFAGLVAAAMLFLGVGTTMAINREVPIGQKLAYYYDEDRAQEVLDWTLQTATPNIFYLLFAGTWVSEGYIGDVFFGTVYGAGGNYQLVGLPMEDGRELILIENFDDGDVLVDAVTIWNGNPAELLVLYDVGEKVPSIYSATFAKEMSKILHEHVYTYEAPIFMLEKTTDSMEEDDLCQ